DFVSDISGSRIAFSEGTATGSAVAVFDTKTLFRTDIPGNNASSKPATGGSLVAYEDRSFFAAPNQSEICVYDFSTGLTTRLTDDTLMDKTVAVSPDGSALVFEKCDIQGMSCDIYASVQTAPGVFSTYPLTGAAGSNRDPHTNGQVVVYTSTRSG